MTAEIWIALIWLISMAVIGKMSCSYGKATGHQEGWIEGIERGFEDYLRNMKTVVKTVVKDKDDLEALSCNRNCGQRRTVSQDQRHKLKDIANKHLLSNAKEIPCRKCGKGKDCDLLDIPVRIGCYMFEPLNDEPSDDDDEEQEATDEQQRVEGAEEVEEYVRSICYVCGGEPGLGFGMIIKDDGARLCGDECKEDYIAHIEAGYTQEEILNKDFQFKNHRTAAEKIAKVNKDSANPADEAVADTKKVLVETFGDKVGRSS